MARYNTPEGRRWAKKTPGDFPWIMHQALIGAKVGSEVVVGVYPDIDEATRHRRILKQLEKMIYNYPLHSTTRELAKRPKQAWRARAIMLSPSCFELRVYGTNDLRRFEEFEIPVVLIKK